MGTSARVTLVSITVSASFGLTGCAAINDLKVSICQWLDTVNFTGEREVLPGKASDAAHVIALEKIPKQAAKRPKKKIKEVARKLQQPQTVVLPPMKPPMSGSPETAIETRGQSSPLASIPPPTPYSEAPTPFDERFCAECWGLPAKAE